MECAFVDYSKLERAIAGCKFMVGNRTVPSVFMNKTKQHIGSTVEWRCHRFLSIITFVLKLCIFPSVKEKRTASNNFRPVLFIHQSNLGQSLRLFFNSFRFCKSFEFKVWTFWPRHMQDTVFYATFESLIHYTNRNVCPFRFYFYLTVLFKVIRPLQSYLTRPCVDWIYRVCKTPRSFIAL